MEYIDFKRIERVVKFDKGIFKEIRDDKNAMPGAVVVLLLASIIGSIWSILASFGLALIGVVIFTPIGWFIGTGILHIIAKLFGGKSTFEGYLKVTAYAEAPTALGVIPLIGTFVGGIWSLIILIAATRDAHELSTGKAVLVVLIPAIIVAIIIILLIALLIPFSAMGPYGPGPYNYNYGGY